MIIKTETEQCLNELRTNKLTLTAEKATAYACLAVSHFFEYNKAIGKSFRPAIEILCELNTHPDTEIARIGLSALFPNLIEKLNDSFTPRNCELYDHVFAQVISFCCQLPEGSALKAALDQVGIKDETAILVRKFKLNQRLQKLSPDRKMKKILVLSRVTIGADIAVTSVIISHLKQQFPATELVILGSPKLTELYGGDLQIRVREINYGRSSSLIARLNIWLEVKAAVQAEVLGLDPDQFCIFDPDSRLTQLGLLPLVKPDIESGCYYFFESRSFLYPEPQKIGQLTSSWMNEVLGITCQHFPFISLSAKSLSRGQEIADQLRSNDERRIISLSFGVGGNLTKRISEEFENELLQVLLNDSIVILDKGASTEETESVNRVVSLLQNQRKTIVELNEQNYPSTLNVNLQQPDLVVWQGSIGSFASFIASSDEYLGYDSSGQHLAAALGVPSITIFVNSGNEIFAQRWQSSGAGRTEIIPLESSQIHSNPQLTKLIIQRILQLHQSFNC